MIFGAMLGIVLDPMLGFYGIAMIMGAAVGLVVGSGIAASQFGSPHRPDEDTNA